MIDSFLRYVRYEKRLSGNTVIAYQKDLEQFSSFIQTTFHQEDVAGADHGMVRSWIISLVDEGLNPASVNRKIACLRTFFKFLLREQVIKTNPMTKIRVLKTPKRLPAFVKESDMNQVLDGRDFEDSFAGWRERLVLELFYGTGIRLSELTGLTERSVDLKGRTIKVLGKRKKERVIPFSAHLVTILEGYLSMKRRSVSTDSDTLLVTDSGHPCYPMMIYRIVKNNLSTYTTAEKTSPHVLRHTYATHLLNKGAEINAVKDLLGHSSLAATQVYTHNSMEKIKKAFDQAHPKA